MRRYLLVCFLVFAMMIPFASVTGAYPDGLLEGKTGYRTSPTGVLTDKSQPFTAATDGNMSTSVVINGGYGSNSVLWFELDNVQSIGSVKGRTSQNAPLYFYDANKSQISNVTVSANETIVNFPPIEGVKYVVWINILSTATTIYDFDVFPALPAPPSTLVGKPDNGLVDLTWLTVPDAVGYNIYRNNVKINKSLLSPTTTSYRDTEVINGTTYTYQYSVITSTGQETRRSQPISVKPMALPEQIIPVLAYSDLTTTSFNLNWTESGLSYQLYNDQTHIADLTDTSYMVKNLQSDKFYKYKVVATDQFGRVATSNELTVLTKKESPTVNVTDIKHDGFTLLWSSGDSTDTFDLYLDDEIVETDEETKHTFTGLTSQRDYTYKLVAKSVTGNTSEISRTIKTGTSPLPAVTGAQLTTMPGGDPTKKNLTYTTNGYVSGVKVFLNDKLVGTYPVTQTDIPLDFSSITDMFAKIRIEPIEPDGKIYEFQSMASSTGNEDFDEFLAQFLDMFKIGKTGFFILALLALPITVAVCLFFWTRRKSKKLVLGSGAAPGSGGSDAKKDYKSAKYKTPYIPWNKMTDEQKLQWRSEKHYQKTGYRINDRQVLTKSYGFLGLGGEKKYENLTFEKDGVLYKQQYVRGRGKVYVPKDTKNQLLHVKNQVQQISKVFKPPKQFQKGGIKNQLPKKFNTSNQVSPQFKTNKNSFTGSNKKF